MTVPFLDLKAQYQLIKDEVRPAIDRVLESCTFVLGEEVAAFEREFAAYCGAPYAVAVNSGTSALHLALLAARVGPGDEVITVPFTFVATVSAIRYTGARPVFVDIDAKSYTLDVRQLEQAITPRTKAILPVHLYGQPADMDPILDVAHRHGLIVIEDAAQAHGAAYKGRPAGSLGDLACFSFYPGKNLGAYGEGGMVVTANPDLARTIATMRDWGQEKKYHHVLPGYNYRLEGIQGAVLRVKLRHLEALDRGSSRPRSRATTLDSPGVPSVRRRPFPTAGTSTTSTPSASRSATRSSGRSTPVASRRASITRSQSTSSRRTPILDIEPVTSPKPSELQRKCSPCRCIQN